MPPFDIIKQSPVDRTFRVEAIRGMFDLKDEIIEEHFRGSIELPAVWNIGIITGRSGTGKTTIARTLFDSSYFFQPQYQARSVVDDMPKGCEIKDVLEMFNACGFSSTPSWLKPYDVLSQGEKMRVDLARALLETKEIVVFDEFTSVVDRQVAQIGSFTVQKRIRRENRKFIAVTCHSDVIDWLLPDWIFDTNTMTYSIGVKKNDQRSVFNWQKGDSKIGNCLLDITI